MAEICQNRTVGKDRFFRKSSIAQIKKFWTIEISIITRGMWSNIFSSKWRPGLEHEFISWQHRICFQDSNSSNLTFFQLEATLGTKKVTRSGYYRGNNFQDSTKTKIAEIKTLGYLPKVLFFNVFELDVEKE